MTLFQKVKNKLSNQLSHAKARSSYSQSGEDMIVDYIFSVLGIDLPTYLDIGAHNPFHMSNTAYFYGKGCRGINVEPDPVLFAAFKKFRSEDVNLNVGVAGTCAELAFYRLSASTLNTFSKEEAERLCANHGYSIKEVVTIPVLDLKTVIDRHASGVFPHFLSVDVEGLDEEILHSIDYDHSYPLVICVETISFETDGTGVKNQVLIDFLVSKGYMLYADTYINSIFVRRNNWLKA